MERREHGQIIMTESCFRSSYAEARERFLSAASAAGAELSRLELAQRSPEGEPLSIDLALIGSTTPRRVVVHCSGTHGVEGYAGSAIQAALLDDPPKPAEGDAILLIHALNPYGMAWLRRANECNIDLNRNCLLPGETWQGAPEGYAGLDPFLNPLSTPEGDHFFLRALYRVLRHGSSNLKRSIATGQHDYPNGLFYGGQELAEGPRLLRDWLTENLSSQTELFVIDVHTGLGPFAEGTLLHRGERSTTARLNEHFSRPVLEDDAGNRVVDYLVRGSLSNLFVEQFGASRVDFLTQEFGTCSPFKVLDALRSENRYHHFGDRALDHWSKMALVEAFNPSSSRWQEQVLEQGLEAVREATVFLGN